MSELSILGALTAGMAGGTIKTVDLTATLTPEYPVIELPPEFGQAAQFQKKEISRYDERGPAWYWNDFTLNEHTGTHFDAPIHWVSGKDLPNNAVDTIPPHHFIAPVCVVDVSREVAADQDFILTRGHLEEWEAEHGRIPAGSWLFMRSDWAKVVSPDNFKNEREDGAHHPGPDAGCVRFLVEERDVLGFGSECVGTDHGQAFHFDPPLPCHFYMHGAGKYGLQCMINLDQLPPTGAVIVAAPLKIEEGSGSPLRVLALVPA
tara:strand:- start:36000 stop:36785 length:786 start_codon:yes stop_codon:yes gene_type:complete